MDGMFLCEQKILVIIKYINRQLGPMQCGLCLKRAISVLYYTHSQECVNVSIGDSPSWPKATVFEIVIISSNLISPASFRIGSANNTDHSNCLLS